MQHFSDKIQFTETLAKSQHQVMYPLYFNIQKYKVSEKCRTTQISVEWIEASILYLHQGYYNKGLHTKSRLALLRRGVMIKTYLIMVNYYFINSLINFGSQITGYSKSRSSLSNDPCMDVYCKVFSNMVYTHSGPVSRAPPYIFIHFFYRRKIGVPIPLCVYSIHIT